MPICHPVIVSAGSLVMKDNVIGLAVEKRPGDGRRKEGGKGEKREDGIAGSKWRQPASKGGDNEYIGDSPVTEPGDQEERKPELIVVAEMPSNKPRGVGPAPNQRTGGEQECEVGGKRPVERCATTIRGRDGNSAYTYKARFSSENHPGSAAAGEAHNRLLIATSRMT